MTEPDPFKTDDENPEWTEEDFARARPAREVMSPELYAAVTKRRGRPPLENPKAHVNLRIDADVLAAWRASGKGWQSRMNDALRAAAPKG